MHVIVIGCGKVGAKFAQVLSEEGHDIVIVDNDNNAFKALGPNFNGITVTGVPIDQDVLKQAGIQTADAIAAVTPDDNVNIMVCQVAKEIFKVPRVIARIYNPAREHVFHEFGLDTICPTNITVDVIRSIVLGDEGVSKHTIGNTAVAFRHEKVLKTYEGKKLDSIKITDGSMVFGVIQNGSFVFANSGIKLNKDDILVIADKVK
ncbi:MAG: TrkA family potassium uptake protein [Clostridia bacterium]|nr:TrkA family potassium uptake protein [Clostridia bacterium]